MDFAFREAAYNGISGLIQQVVDRRAFIERLGDETPFILEAAKLFAGGRRFGIIVAAKPEEEPVGFVMIIPGEADDELEIGPTYVAPDQRGQGLARAMVTFAVDWAREHGQRRLVVATWGKNARARHVFESVGFTLLDEEIGARVDGDSTVRFSLDLG